MFDRSRLSAIFVSFAALAALCAGSLAQAQDTATAVWQVSKSSGDVWVTAAGVQPASLTDQASVKPGDSIRTGRNGRVLLVRGQETILVAPNSAITIPATQQDSGSTTIVQQSGSILLEVDKRNVRNFEVETPYLVAAVKGTQFKVSVNQGNASVDVLKGSVQVADFKSGQYALVLPGQSAKVSTQGQGGLSLNGPGVLNPILKGEPRAPTVQHLPVPRAGLSAPQGVAAGQHVRALGNSGAGHGQGLGQGHGQSAGGALHIGAALGEVKLDIHKVTNGLAHDTSGSASSHRASQPTVWSSGDIVPGNGVSKTYNQGNNGSGTGAGGVSGASGGNGNAGGNGNGNGNGNAGGNGNGNGNGNAGGNGNGNGNAGGNGNGNAGGNGDDNGNGNANGHHKPHGKS
jgi:hypothetical protein